MKVIDKDRSLKFNHISIIGRLCATPEKNFTKKDKVYARFFVKTVYKDGETFIPFIMFGKEIDIVCTKFHQGDVVAVHGQIETRENKDRELIIDFIATEIRLITKSKLTHIPTEDKFKKIVALYDLKAIDKRFGRS